MPANDFNSWPDERMVDVLFTAEDRIPLELALEISRRDNLLPFLAHIAMDKQSWLAELPEWWAVVHATYLMGYRGGEEVVTPLLSALRWADAFDCDWVNEVLPSILGNVGEPLIPGLTAALRDQTAGWSARDLAMKGLAAITIKNPQSTEHAFKIIGQRLMDEGEDRVVRQLAGHILLDFRRQEYRMALLKFAREEWGGEDMESLQPFAFGPEDVDWTFHQPQQDLWHYQDDWMKFYQPSEIQRRQKRWAREHLTAPSRRSVNPSRGQLISLWRRDDGPTPPNPPNHGEPDDPVHD